jgi:DNA polymerase-3 subunit epsilon
MREIALDTETTGLDPHVGHRMVEIGCVELFNHVPTGKTWHYYINPERDIPPEASAVHGIMADKVKKAPVFAELVGSFSDFIKDARLVIHNAEFDLKFINYQMKDFGYPPIKIADVVDTLWVARKKFPGQPASLDALCRRFNIDLSGREFHGALLDAQLLADVYLELVGGRQHGLGLESRSSSSSVSQKNSADLLSSEPSAKVARVYRAPREFPVDEAEQAVHDAMRARIKESLWSKV